MAKKSFRKNAQQSLGGVGAIIQRTVPPASPEISIPAVKESAEPAISKEPKKESTEPQSKAPTRKKRKTSSKKVEDGTKSQKGCKPGDTRKTFIIKIELAEKMQDIAYWEPGKLKDHMNAALEAYVKKKWTKKRPKDA